MFVVTTVVPEGSSTVFALGEVRLSFSDPVDPATMADSISLITADFEPVAAVRALVSGQSNVVTLTPKVPLEPGEYRVIVTSQLTSQYGEQLNTGDSGAFYSTFTLQASAFNPDINVEINPLGHQLGIITAIPPSQSYGLQAGEAAIVFNEPISLVKLIASTGDNLADALTLDRSASASIDDNTLLLNWKLHPNKRYLFDLAVMGQTSRQVVSMKLDYYSLLDPGFVTVNQIRNDLGSLIKGIPSLTIFLLISDCSLLAMEIAKAAGANALRTHRLALAQYTRYVVEYRLIREFVLSNLLTRDDQKKLGDFQVSREKVINPKAVDVLNRLEKDVIKWEDVLVGFAGLGPVAPGSATKGSKHYLVHPGTNYYIRDEYGDPINDPYIPSRTQLPSMWEPRFRRTLP